MFAQPSLGLLPFTLTPQQAALVDLPLGEPQSLFLEGPAGCGKTTAGAAHLLRLLTSGVPADSVLVLVPQRTLGQVYVDLLRSPAAPAGAQVDVLTVGGLAQRSVELYWPLVAGPAGFAHPDRPPIFLTLETAQYYMDRLIKPYVDRDAFGDVTLSRQRLISQILDNLNKAAVARFAYQEIGSRLSQAWSGDSSRLRVYEQVQACTTDFRRFCLAHNLLDFSLQVEVFDRHVLALPEAATALHGRYRHILADNVEEDVPVAHHLIGNWLAECESAWVIYDDGGGLRSYLGADPASAYALRKRCRAHQRFETSLVNEAPLLALAQGVERTLGLSEDGGTAEDDPRPGLTLLHEGFHTESIRTVANQIHQLVDGQGLPPGEIAVLAPFMTDALRFSLVQALDRKGIRSYSRRPSRALRDEPSARCLLTLAKLAHPAWGLVPPRTDVAHALLAAVEGMDLVRAWHLTAIVYRPAGAKASPPLQAPLRPTGAKASPPLQAPLRPTGAKASPPLQAPLRPGGTRAGHPTLAGFEQVRAEEQLKVTYLLGNRYEALRQWLAAYAEGPSLPLDHFFGRLFDELLGRPGYVFHQDRDSAAVTAHLMDSARRFRQTVGEEEPFTSGAFVSMVEEGVVAAQYLPAAVAAPDAVLLAPAFTFAMGNRPVAVQFWLNLSSSTWARRLYQPLTHPYVLSKQWRQGATWTDADEDLANRRTLYRLALALVRRCRRHIYLVDSTYNERGMEEHGMLQQVVFRTLRRAARTHGVSTEVLDV